MNVRSILIPIILLFSIQAQAQLEMVKDLVTGKGSSSPDLFHVLDKEIYFYSNTLEIWRSDGTSAGTKLIRGVPKKSSVYIRQLTSAAGLLYFNLTDDKYGSEVWVYDPKVDSAHVLKDLDPGNSQSFFPLALQNVNDTMYMIAYSPQSHYQVWRTDGTEAGTIKISQFNSLANIRKPVSLFNAGGRLMAFYMDSNNGNVFYFNLYLYDHAVKDFVLLKAFTNNSFIQPGNFLFMKDTAYFTMDDGINGNELWVTDYTSAGTHMVSNICSGQCNSNPRFLCAFNSRMYFSANINISYQLWSTDGSSFGTKLIDLKTGQVNPYPQNMVVFQDKLYLIYYSNSLLKLAYLDKEDQLHPVYTDDSTDILSFSTAFFSVNNRLMFFGSNGKVQALFEIKGDRCVIVQVVGSDLGKNNLPTLVQVKDNEIYFNGGDELTGKEFWRSRFNAPGKYMFGFDHFMYPNPVTSSIHILPRFFEYYKSDFSVEIFNSIGQSVLRKEGMTQDNFELDVVNLGSGMYTILLTTETGQKLIERFVKL